MLLPPRPLRLNRLFVVEHITGGPALLLVGLAAACLGGWVTFGDASQLAEESRIWENGVPASQVSATCRVRTQRLVIHEHKVSVRYTDANGAEHRGYVDFSTLGAKYDGSKEAVVRYLREAPDRFALSWAVDAGTARILLIVLLALGMFLATAAFGALGMRMLRRFATARRLAARSDEIAVRVVKVEPQLSRGRHKRSTFHYEGRAASGRELSGKESFPLDRPPLFADASGRTIVALVDPDDPSRLLLVHGDFLPFEPTPDEQAAIRAAIALRRTG